MFRNVLVLVVVLLGALARGDTVESTSGTVMEGKLVSRDDKTVVIEVQVNGKPVQRRLALQYVKAITVNGNREVISGPGKTPAAAPPGATGRRSRGRRSTR
ncbi:MAG: hypothetical protein QM813_06070 [Verrucomicrobiota bacterium]